jgi:ribosomal protein L7/L12
MKCDEALELAQAMKEQGSAIEEILARLRASGVTIVDSLKVVRRIEGGHLGEAKEIIDSSEAWADRREANEQIRSMLFRAVLEEGGQLDPP